MPGGRFGFVMPVVGESVDVALKKLRRKLIKDGIVRDFRNNRYYEKPTEIRVKTEKEQSKRIVRREIKDLLRVIAWRQQHGL